MAISNMALRGLLKISWMGRWSVFFMRDVATATKSDNPHPARKYIHGRPLPTVRPVPNLPQPSDVQNGSSRRTLSVMYKNRIITADHRIVVPTRNLGV